MNAAVTARPGAPLRGTVSVPGDKSISHRSLILGALAPGRTTVTGLLEADDVLRTAAALRAFGATIERDGSTFVVEGGPWRSPGRTVYCGNSGTGARLLMGAAAGQGIVATFDGDRSLRGRPMGRVLGPLAALGVKSEAREGRLPVTIAAGRPIGGKHRLEVASAQVKSALLLAGLGAQGETTIEEPVLSRDHTERMLPQFGAFLQIEPLPDGRRLRLAAGATLKPASVVVPGDPSSAAFLVAAATLVQGSDITLERVLMNPHRIGFFDAMRRMGADLTAQGLDDAGGEPVARIRVRAAEALQPIRTEAADAPAMIDEYPILAVVAAFAEGTSRFEGLGELRVKESDRLAATAAMLAANGVEVRTGEDWLEVDGGQPAGGGLVATHDDHRIAMSALVLGMAARNPVGIDHAEMIATSFPDFFDLFANLGADVAPGEGEVLSAARTQG
jgi:3-phosphoshikimate 1-carboxyvinyltransferase